MRQQVQVERRLLSNLVVLVVVVPKKNSLEKKKTIFPLMVDDVSKVRDGIATSRVSSAI